MKNNSLKHYHSICEALNFDTYLVASVLHSYQDLECIDTIFKNLENLKLDSYAYALEDASKLSYEELKLLSDSYGFKSENSYIQYLTSLLQLNNIFFLDFRVKDFKKENKYTTGSLF